MYVDTSDIISTIVVDAPEADADSSEMEKEKKFDSIVLNVNQTIKELSQIYSTIGYSSQEISAKKAEIFSHIENTISNFVSSLQREKNSIENECEWLRQQIRIILAMINESRGEKSLSLLERGLAFNDNSLYEEGYKEEVLRKLAQIQQRKLMTQDFNDNQMDYEQQYDYMMKTIPQLSLIELKNKLNSIFLEVLKAFVVLFKKLNDLNLEYVNKGEIVGDIHSQDANSQILSTLHSKEEAEMHQSLINEFESIIEEMNLSKKNSGLKHPGSKDDSNTFILSSPRKSKKEKTDQPDSQIDSLRDINYQLVRVIRGLKITKITPDILSAVQKEIDYCNREIESRKQRIGQITETCFFLIKTLHLNNDQLLEIQKSHEVKHDGSDGFFDIETLRLIQHDPSQFGLVDAHLNYLDRFCNILQNIKDTKQQKWEHYVSTCQSLWEKLGESAEYTENFLKMNSALTDISLMNLKLELNKLYMKRSEFIESFISDARVEIEKLWDKMFYGKEQRVTFRYYNYDADDDSHDKETVLSEHEQELARLESEYTSKSSVLIHYEQLNGLIKDQEFLRESSKNSERLLSKDSCKILLNEEKIRKRINKNLPRLLEGLKSEIVKYNNSALQEGKKPISINGEDFFEKILIIESEQLNQSSARSTRGFRKPRTTTSVSPTRTNNKAPINRTRPIVSPVKTSRSPTSMSARASRPTLSRRTSPLNTLSERTFNNPTTIRLTNAINSSMSGSSNSSTSSAESPIHMGNSFSPMKSFVAHLQPLNSPLVADGNKMSQISKRNLNHNLQKEYSSPYEMSPIKINLKNSSGRKHSISTCDTSTLIGDDYQHWRNEKIKQMNSMQ
ncbi:hypothetical protein PICST_54013 [Scheffersomyces stipitis CBS 6054]|uniref:Anaphase spindle elongation protein n=1 Tax=Scheffersomyces stipitis (strain ATCC 58785 / CBS 6054 / NBRC 10063 / NRRL Y-11545) TaxID=322104 RepID=A3LPZ0_PICST|nr:hypothetical protein PICST_54013 [Scheffersomyces stipitis CBS 6054]ABN64583.2 hypothetical protein PICST_54013 [Scheffersomyces stipitis CBS 6054]